MLRTLTDVTNSLVDWDVLFLTLLALAIYQYVKSPYIIHTKNWLVIGMKQMTINSNLSKMKKNYKETIETVLENSAVLHMACSGLRVLNACRQKYFFWKWEILVVYPWNNLFNSHIYWYPCARFSLLVSIWKLYDLKKMKCYNKKDLSFWRLKSTADIILDLHFVFLFFSPPTEGFSSLPFFSCT